MRDEALYERLAVIDPPQRLIRNLQRAALVAVHNVDMEARTPSGLTEPELETLLYRSHGLSDSMVAEALGVTVDTVKYHLKGVRYRLQAKDTTHAVALALRQGLIV
jgi:DNA-binding CsgD family transcriptional regulator